MKERKLVMKTNLKRQFAMVGIAITVFLAACSNGTSSSVATVNGEEISKDELNEAMLSLYGNEVLNTLISNKVIELEGEKEKIEVTEEEIQAELDELIEMYGGEETFQAIMESNNLSEEMFREDIRIYKLTSKLMEKEIDITDEDISTYFEENKSSFDQQEQVEASHILVDDEATAKEVKQKLDNGDDFAELVKEFSSDVASAESEGELGYFAKGDMVEEFETAAFGMEINEISDPVKTEYGYHIIKVTGKKEAKEATLEEVKEEVREVILESRINEEYSSWLTALLEEYEIENTLEI